MYISEQNAGVNPSNYRKRAEVEAIAALREHKSKH
jgi:uncharacterized protein (DUF1330 family)